MFEENNQIEPQMVEDKEAAKKAARKASAEKMLARKKAAIKTLVDWANQTNTGDNLNAEVKEAADYLAGLTRTRVAGGAKTSVVEEIFPEANVAIPAIDIFMKFEKGRHEMIQLAKIAAKKNIIIEYNEADKTYTRK